MIGLNIHSKSIFLLNKHLLSRCRERNINSKSTLLEIARQFDDEAMLKLIDALGNDSLERDGIRKAARAERVMPGPVGVNENVNRSFRYSVDDPKCVVEIRFNEPDLMSRASVLKVLKGAFDAVKNDEIEISIARSTGK